MNDIGSIFERILTPPTCGEGRISRGGLRDEMPAEVEAQARPDRVELSEAAVNYDPEAEETARITRIRSQIAEGTYLTPEKIDAAIEKLLEELLGR
jgi:anti-sigma28 factor (negative regulator of flagellin synthesis)